MSHLTGGGESSVSLILGDGEGGRKIQTAGTLPSSSDSKAPTQPGHYNTFEGNVLYRCVALYGLQFRYFPFMFSRGFATQLLANDRWASP